MHLGIIKMPKEEHIRLSQIEATNPAQWEIDVTDNGQGPDVVRMKAIRNSQGQIIKVEKMTIEYLMRSSHPK